MQHSGNQDNMFGWSFQPESQNTMFQKYKYPEIHQKWIFFSFIFCTNI